MDIQELIVNRDQHMRPLEYDLSENFNELVRYLNDMGVLDNVPVGVTSESEIVSISDAYPAPPRALNVCGASTQNGTPTPDAPVPILSVDDLALNVVGKNLFDQTDVVAGTYINSSGQRAAGNSNTSTNFIPIIGGETYTISFSTSPAAGNYLAWYADADESTVTGTVESLRYAPTKTVTAPSDARYVRFSCTKTIVDSAQLELGSAATSYEPYQSQTVPDLLPDGTSLRSLPDGTKDTLNLSYLRPSTREGWAWYSRELVTKLYEQNVSTFDQFATNSAGHPRVRANVSANARGGESHSRCNRFVYNSATYNYGVSGDYYISGGYAYFILPDTVTSATEANAWLSDHPTIMLRDATTTTTTTLDPIELPQLPAPNCTVWCDGGSAQPTLMLEYVRDTNTALADLSEAIADIVSG